jgi:small GTP-binding protein
MIEFNYDVFLSYSPKDKDVVQELEERLKAIGIKVWRDDWEQSSGEIEHRLQQSNSLLLAMSANAFGADWVRLERQLALFRDPTDAQRRFIPVLLDNVEIKETLKPYAYLDLRARTDAQFENILKACSPRAEDSTSLTEPENVWQPDTLKGSGSYMWSVAVTSNGRRAVSGSGDALVRVWDLDNGECVATLRGHTARVLSVCVSPDGRKAISGSGDSTLRLWNLDTGTCEAIRRLGSGEIKGIAATQDFRFALSCSDDHKLQLWDLERVERIQRAGSLKGGGGFDVALNANGDRAVSGSSTSSVQVWNALTGRRLVTLNGHNDQVKTVAISASGNLAVSGSDDRTLRVWDLTADRCVAILEGHTAAINKVAVTPDGSRVVSCSKDNTVRLWDVKTGRCEAVFKEDSPILDVVITPDGRRIVCASWGGDLLIWDLPATDEFILRKADATRYTNAKVLLVGDSGVGKSGLAMRLTQGHFEPTISSDAAWATQLRVPHELNTTDIEREIWLWDFAGQADYRLIHQLYMDETALAVLVFNPQSENPFDSLGEWDRDLQKAARGPFKKLLIAGRCDRGGLMVSRETVESFRRERGFEDYLETSAYTGKGCEALRSAIIQSIPWPEVTWIASPRIFKLLKDEIVNLRDEGQVLLRISELRQQLEMRLPGETFTLEQLSAVVGLLAGPGIIWHLEFGGFVLLQPERINGYASAVIRSVRAHTEEIGCIAEEQVMAGNLDYQDMKRLSPQEEQIVLRAMHQTFVNHGLCLREHTDKGPLLIFPSYFKRERPELEGHPMVLVTYRFTGPLDEIYATLIVRLHHTDAFERDRLWRFAADFKTPTGKRFGLMMTKKGEGAAELEVFFEGGISNDLQVTFIRYIHEHLKAKGQGVVRLRHYVCGHCDGLIENRRAIQARLDKGLKDIICSFCENRVPLWDVLEEKFASYQYGRRVRKLEAQATAAIDNESRELILMGHAYVVAGEAGQIYRQYTNSDHGIDGEIEFKDYNGKASGKRLYLQLKSGDSYLYARKRDGADVFRIKNPRHAQYWGHQAYPVMLVIRTSDGQIRWMDVTEQLLRNDKPSRLIVFSGEPFTALSVLRFRDKLIGIVNPPRA